MDLDEVVRRRRMVRRYTDQPVDRAVVDHLLANAVRAPNAGFTQGWAFLVLDTPADVERFWAAATPPARADRPDAWLRGMRTAPVVVVPFSCERAYRERYAEPDKARAGAVGEDGSPGADRGAGPDWAVPYWHVDAGMAALLILQTAVAEGLGACLFGVPASRTHALREVFGIPDDHVPVGAITVGHPAEAGGSGSARRRPRRPLDEVVHRGRWNH